MLSITIFFSKQWKVYSDSHVATYDQLGNWNSLNSRAILSSHKIFAGLKQQPNGNIHRDNSGLKSYKPCNSKLFEPSQIEQIVEYSNTFVKSKHNLILCE